MLRSAGLSPKFHGAYLGAGTGATIAAIITGLVQTYWTHAALSPYAVQGIYTVVTIALAAYGAYVAPPGQVTVVPGTTGPGTTTTATGVTTAAPGSGEAG